MGNSVVQVYLPSSASNRSRRGGRWLAAGWAWSWLLLQCDRGSAEEARVEDLLGDHKLSQCLVCGIMMAGKPDLVHRCVSQHQSTIFIEVALITNGNPRLPFNVHRKPMKAKSHCGKRTKAHRQLMKQPM